MTAIGDVTTSFYRLAASATAVQLLLIGGFGSFRHFGPLGAADKGRSFLANGLILNSSLTVIGGAERPGAIQFGPPQQPGQPRTQTTVSAGHLLDLVDRRDAPSAEIVLDERRVIRQGLGFTLPTRSARKRSGRKSKA